MAIGARSSNQLVAWAKQQMRSQSPESFGRALFEEANTHEQMHLTAETARLTALGSPAALGDVGHGQRAEWRHQALRAHQHARVVAGAHVGVSGHVDEVTGGWSKRREPLRTSKSE